MIMQATELARLLRNADYDAAAAAAEAGESEVALSEARRDELLGTYGVRRSLQADAGRAGVAAEIQQFLDALASQRDQRVYGCTLRDDEHVYVVFLNSSADTALAALVPPRKPDGTIDSTLR